MFVHAQEFLVKKKKKKSDENPSMHEIFEFKIPTKNACTRAVAGGGGGGGGGGQGGLLPPSHV